MQLVTIPDMDKPDPDDLWSHVILLTAGIIMACLSSIWHLLRDTPPRAAIPMRVWAATVIGGLLSGSMVIGILLHLYGWQHPWALLVVSIPAGFGAPLVVAATVNALITFIRSIAEVLSKREK